jgi:hypothetical protein
LGGGFEVGRVLPFAQGSMVGPFETTLPFVKQRLTEEKLEARAHAEGDCLYSEYEPTTSGYGYVAPRIKIEFGARSTGEPIAYEVCGDVLALTTRCPRIAEHSTADRARTMSKIEGSLRLDTPENFQAPGRAAGKSLPENYLSIGCRQPQG